MNYAVPTIPDVDAELRSVIELRGLLDGFFSSIGSMLTVLAMREQSLRDCREELIAHAADLAARELQFCAAWPELNPETRMLSFASIDGAAPAVTSH